MRPIRIALISVLAAFAASAARTQGDDFPYWKPGQKTLAKLDFAFRNAGFWDGSPPAIEKYSRYYAGITIKGRRMVRAEFTNFPDVEIVDGKVEYHVDKNPVHVVPEDQFPGIFDGGCSVVNMLYDVEAERMVSISCNGVA
jgi:hypothetical protein